MRKIIFVIAFIGVVIAACDKSEPVNPFDGQVVNQDTVGFEITQAEPTSFAGIYHNVLKPTCANVGCHDGTFEPDYRTLGSAYNTLVYQTPIKNDGNYTYRVEPFNPQRSAIMARLHGTLAPQMPIQVEPDSDWPEKKSQYIINIQTWISNGAPDITGNIRQINYPAPVLLGAGATDAGLWIERNGGTGPLIIQNDATDIRLYFAFRHDEISPQEFQYNRIIFSSNPNEPSGALELPLNILGSPRYERGFYGDVVAYTHYIDINPAMDFEQEVPQWFFRVYVQDTQNPVTEIPTDNGIYYIKSYMSFTWSQ